jgi:hypothetical protein
LGAATLQDRCPPALVTAQGRLVAIYAFKGTIYRADVEKVLAGKGKPVAVTRGDQPAAQSRDGKINIVYRADGGVRLITIK